MMKRAEHQPVTVGMTIFAGIYCKIYRVPEAGTIIPQHAHVYDHQTMVMQGAVYVERSGQPSGRYDAPAIVKIRAQEKHAFTTLAPNTVLACVHNADHLDDGEPAVAEEHHLVED